MVRTVLLGLCLTLPLAAGCEVAPLHLLRYSDDYSTFDDNCRRTFKARWDRYGEYFESSGGPGSTWTGGEHIFWFDNARLKEGSRHDLLRALRTDLLEMAADSGVTVHRPVREKMEGEVLRGFEFDYSQGRKQGRVTVIIKPDEKENSVEVRCVVREKPRLHGETDE